MTRITEDTQEMVESYCINGIEVPKRIWLTDEGSGDICWANDPDPTGDGQAESVEYVRVDQASQLAGVLRSALAEAHNERAALREALDLARNRLHAAAINEAPKQSREYYDYSQWADEADAALGAKL